VLAVTCNAYEIATASADCSVRLYDIREGRLFVDFMGESATDVHLVADNQSMLVSSMHGNPIRLMEKANGQLLAEYALHFHGFLLVSIHSLVPFSYTGHLNSDYRIECGVLASNNEVVSGSEDGAVYIWDMVESKLLRKLQHPMGVKYVHSISTHPSSQAILTAAQQQVYVWECDESECVVD